ncbi:hypothetical protein [Algoriphagus namhaensis]
MIQSFREKFNQNFSDEKYAQFLDSIAADFNLRPTFRVAESPFFIPEKLKSQILEGSKQVIEFICRPDFKHLTQRAVDLTSNVPNETNHTQFLAIDFGICEEEGEIIPKLIEVQGFPTIFNFQQNLFEKFKETYPFLEETTPYLSGLDSNAYLDLLKKIVLNGHQPHEVILLEVEPIKQNTNIDFFYAERDMGIPVVCVTEIIKEGSKVFYRNKSGEKILVKRIYNRVIFDELDARTDLKLSFKFTDVLDVEWAGHPNWYNRISKFILPYLSGPYFIETKLLSDLNEIPDDLENYVLKPLFSFSGAGVVFHVSKEDIEAVRHKDQYVLQRKVKYSPVVQSPNGKVKAEVRIFAMWPMGDLRPTLVGNLVRLSRGEMIGVKFNKDKDWVGGTIGLFEK